MKATLLTLAITSGILISANAATVWYDFNETNKSKVVDGNSDALQFADDGTSSTVKVQLGLTTANSITKVSSSGSQKDWSTVTTPQLTQWRESSSSTLVANTADAPINNAWETFIGGNTKSLAFTVTISGLTPGEAYGVYIISGTPFESAGGWNKVVFNENTVVDQYMTDTGWRGSWPTATLEVQIPNNLGATGVIADENGEIGFKFVNNNNSHTMAINALAITGVTNQIPEPATTSLGLLGLGALLLRRRRN